MGIVAYCSQGHRVKVKDELAGRKGICPRCGTSFRIPLASRPPPGAASASPAPVSAVPGGLPVARVVSLDGELAGSLPRALPLASPAAAEPPDRAQPPDR